MSSVAEFGDLLQGVNGTQSCKFLRMRCAVSALSPE